MNITTSMVDHLDFFSSSVHWFLWVLSLGMLQLLLSVSLLHDDSVLLLLSKRRYPGKEK
jgi:hypothetical protein